MSIRTDKIITHTVSFRYILNVNQYLKLMFQIILVNAIKYFWLNFATFACEKWEGTNAR